MEGVSKLGTKFDRRNDLLPYDPKKDQHLKLLDIHALRFLKDAKTASELSRHMQQRLSQRDGLVGEYVARR